MIKNMWAAAAAQIEKCTTVLLCFCFAFALLLLCFAFALLTHIFICLLHTHIFIRLLLYRHIFICPLLFIENSLAKDEVASMIPSWLHGAFVHRHQDSVGSNESSDLKIKAWENLHRSANASQIATRHKLCAAVNGRKPAMRVSERVRPTADLTPAPHKHVNTHTVHRHSPTPTLPAWQSFLTMPNFALLSSVTSICECLFAALWAQLHGGHW